MLEETYLLIDDHPSIDDGRAGRLLEFFGVPYETLKATEFRLQDNAGRMGVGKCRLVCSAENFAHVLEKLQSAFCDSDHFSSEYDSVPKVHLRDGAGVRFVRAADRH